MEDTLFLERDLHLLSFSLDKFIEFNQSFNSVTHIFLIQLKLCQEGLDDKDTILLHEMDISPLS